MKILYYSPHPYLNLQDPTGYGTHMREMIHAFRKRNNEVLPVIMGGVNGSIEKPREVKSNRGKKKYIPKPLWELAKDFNLLLFDRNARKVLKQKVDQFKPDVIYERSNYLQTSGVEVARELNIPHILEVNSPHIIEREILTGTRSPLKRYFKKIEKKQFKKTTKIAVVSSTLRDFINKEYEIELDKIVVVPNGIDVNKIKVSETEKQQLIVKYNLNNNHVIGFVGSVHPWHRVDMLIEAFSDIVQSRGGVKLLIVGGGSMIARLTELCRKLNIEDNVIFTGKIPNVDVYKYISVMDITVIPGTKWFMMPVKLFEYGALGKPVIAIDTQAIRDVMVDGEEGLLFKSDKRALTESLSELINDEEKRTEYGINFKRKVMKQYTWENNAKYVLEQII